MTPPMTRRSTKENIALNLREPSCPWWLVGLLCLLGMFTLVSCSHGTDAHPKELAPGPSQTQIKIAPTAPPEAAARDNAPLPHIDSKRAFQYTREVTAF